MQQFLGTVDLVQFEFFAVAAFTAATLFTMGFLLGRVSRAGASVKVPMEVIHALASARIEPRAMTSMKSRASDKDAHPDVTHAIEAILAHVHAEKDFKKAQAYALHEIEKLEHDHGDMHELEELHDKIAHAHNHAEMEAALKAYIGHANH